MTLRKAAGLLVAVGLMLGLIGAGVSAQFSDSATATAQISVGTFGIQISSSTSGAVIDTVGLGGWNHSVTLSCGTLQSSAAGTCPLQFTITNMGSMPLTFTITGTTPAAPFTSLLAVPVAATPLAAGAHADFNAGLSWPELANGNLGQSTSITYTISASA